MRRIPAGQLGSSQQALVAVDSIDLDADWRTTLRRIVPSGTLRPVQTEALSDFCLLQSRRNIVVSAPTNSGKSLVGDLVLYQAVRSGRRAVLVEPLRALAQEKALDLMESIRRFPAGFFNEPPRVILSTGDQRLELEAFTDPPPQSGEIIVSTPERLDSILRNPETEEWIASIGALVVDEAHLIGSANRGPTLELAIGSFNASDAPPRVVLLSATIGEPERLRNWLNPCDLVTLTERHPPLRSEVLALEAGEEADAVLAREIGVALNQPDSAALVFVHQRASCKKLSHHLNSNLRDTFPTPIADAYHSGMSVSDRAKVREGFAQGDIRCVVTTTALALGVNLPATHVFLRDPTFYGEGRVEPDTIIQILGRAGRGDRPGYGTVIVRPNDRWDAEALGEALRESRIPAIRSAFETTHGGTARAAETEQRILQNASALAAAVLVRATANGMTSDRLNSILGHTLAGESLLRKLPDALRWLESADQALAFEREFGVHQLTVLGKRGVRAALPISYVASFGRLIRDILSFDETDRFLAQWTRLDHLLLACLLHNRTRSLRRYSSALADQVDGWHEIQGMAAKSMIFREWIMGRGGVSRADELLGSVAIEPGDGRNAAQKKGYMAMFHAILLEERARGTTTADLTRRWQVSDLSGIEEVWRDAVIWLLAGHAQISEVRSFYHHLIEGCAAEASRIRRVKRQLRTIRRLALDAQGRLQYCSPLGPMLLGLRSFLKGHGGQIAGIGTIRRLEEQGVTSMAQLVKCTQRDLVGMGVREKFARQIHAHARRQMR